MNQLYDVIIVGASEEGINFCDLLLKNTIGLKVALVSRNFNRPAEFEGITKVNKEVVKDILNLYQKDNETIQLILSK